MPLKSTLINPNYAEAFNNIGAVQQDQNKLEDAISSYKKAIEIRPYYSEAFIGTFSILTKYTHDNDHFHQVKCLYENDGLSEIAKCNLCFALAKMYEDIGEIKLAFERLAEGNSHRSKLLNYSIDSDILYFRQLLSAQESLKLNTIKFKETPNNIIPFFIVGMPRSGTTLVEQIVSSHSLITGAGELGYIDKYGRALALGYVNPSEEKLLEFRSLYLTELSKLSAENLYVTDKMPQNFRFIHLICGAFTRGKNYSCAS